MFISFSDSAFHNLQAGFANTKKEINQNRRLNISINKCVMKYGALLNEKRDVFRRLILFSFLDLVASSSFLQLLQL